MTYFTINRLFVTTYQNEYNIIIGWGAVFSIQSLEEFLVANDIICTRSKHIGETNYVWSLGFNTKVLLGEYGIKCDFYYNEDLLKDVFICIDDGCRTIRSNKIDRDFIKLEKSAPDTFDNFCYYVSHTIECGHLVYIQKIV